MSKPDYTDKQAIAILLIVVVAFVGFWAGVMAFVTWIVKAVWT
jgi:hypothetical protein